MPAYLIIFGIVALVLTISALTSGLVERAPLSFPIIFLGLGFLFGPLGFGLITLDAHNPLLEVVAILTLALVLFLDAVKLQVEELGSQWQIPVLVLGPGTLLIIALIAAAAMGILGLGVVAALLMGAMLASTDPVVLRDVVRDRRLPRSIRQALKIEAGTNDLVVLPIILVLIAVARGEASGVGDWAIFLAKLLIVGPAVGFIVGGGGSWLMSRVDRRFGIRTEFQALYGIGLVLAAFTAGTAVGGDGFLAAFAAGLAVTVLNQELCACFLDYGEVTSEMAMLLAFVLFGVVLSSLFTTIAIGPALLLAVLAIFVIRPAVLTLVLARTRLSGSARAFLGWFGPRGLNSLLLALLAVQAGLPGAESLLGIIGAVVVVSVVVHGASATPLVAWYSRRLAGSTLDEEREGTAGGLLTGAADDVPRMTPAELARQLAGPNPPLVLDVRSRSSYEHDRAHIPGDIRVLPDEVIEWAADHAPDRSVVTYCT